MDNASRHVSVERIPAAFFREALDLALEAVIARGSGRVSEGSRDPQRSGGGQGRQQRMQRRVR
jgi:hypothetical protein